MTALLVTAAVTLGVPPVVEQRVPLRHTVCGQGHLLTAYSAEWHALRREHPGAQGRNIRRQGLRRGHPSRCRDVRRSLMTLRRLRYVPPHVVASRPNVAVGSGQIEFMPECTWRPESGGDYGAYNSASGARGKYQVIPSTHAAHCSDLGWSPREQDICAGRIIQAQGPGAWVNC